MATIKNLVIDQGSTFALTITVSDALANPLDLTQYSARAQLRKTYGSATYTAFSVLIGTPRFEGEITISLTAEQTSALKAGRYVYDIEIYDNEDNVTRVLEGIITVTPEVTR